MAATEIANGDAQNVLRWSKSLARETLDKMFCKRFMGTGNDSILQVHRDLESMAGDTIKYDVLYQNRGDGVQGDSTLEGFEEALEFYQDSVKIDFLRQAHNWRGMSQQRTLHDLRKLSRSSLSEWYAWKLDTMMFAYLAGAYGNGTETAAGTIGSSGFAGNALQTPDTDHLIDNSGSTFGLSMIDDAVNRAKVINPRVRPAMVDGQPKYAIVLHPNQVLALKNETGDTKWTMIQARAANSGSKNPIYTGALGEYAGVVIHESEFVPQVTDSTGAAAETLWTNANDAAALFLGAQAGSIAFGNAYSKGATSKSMFKWVENSRDYDHNQGVGVSSCFGLKKNRFNSKDFGAITIVSTDAPA